MKAKTVAIILSVLLVAAAAAGCSGSPAAETGGAGSAARSNLYGEWTKSDWESASPEEKELAVIFLVEEAAASQGGDAEVVQSIIDQAEETLTAEQYDEIEGAITDYFDSAKEGATLQDALGDVRSTISKYVALG